MSHPQGYPPEWFVDHRQAEKFICPVCLCVLKTASELQCGHIFCENCIKHWKEEKSDASCPKCREPIKVIQASFGKQKKVNQLLTYCPRKDQGCDRTFQLHQRISPNFDLTYHNPPCIYQQVTCSQCGEQVQFGDLDPHKAETCKAREMKCEVCKQSYPAYKALAHEQVCPKATISCERKCGTSFPREEMQSHKQDCANEPVTCPFAQFGCSDLVLRKELEEHKREIAKHLLGVAKTCDTKLKRVQDELEKEKKATESLREDLANEKRLTQELSIKLESLMSREFGTKKQRAKSPESGKEKKGKKKETKEFEASQTSPATAVRGTVSVPASPPITYPFMNREVSIKSKHSGKVMTIENLDENNGAALIQADNKNLPSQKFFMKMFDGGFFSIIPRHSQKPLSANNQIEHVTQWEPFDGDMQRFWIRGGSDGSFSIISKFSNKRLEVKKASKAHGALITQGTDSDQGEDYQKWIIEVETSASTSMTSTSITSTSITSPSTTGFTLGFSFPNFFTISSSTMSSPFSRKSCLEACVGKNVAFECKHSGKFLEIRDLAHTEKSPIVQFAQITRASQQWQVQLNPDRTFSFISCHAKLALGYEARRLQSRLVLINPSNTKLCCFQIRQHESDEKAVSFVIQEGQELLAVDVDNSLKTDDAQLILWRMKTSLNQFFRVHLV